MTRRALRQALIVACIAVAAAGAAAPFLPLNFLKPQIESALRRGLGRRVDVDGVSLTLFPGPGFSLSGVKVDEDPRVGIEPFLYAGTVDARVDLLGLLRGRRGFASLRMTDATLNLVKSAQGPWNFQMLLEGPLGPNPGSAEPRAAQMPAVRMRGGRVNLKYADTKSALYFDDVDLDVSRNEDTSLDLRFSGVPERTDRPAQGFSHLYLRGNARPAGNAPQLNLEFEMEPAPLAELAHLLNQPGGGGQASVTVTGRLSGPPSRLDVTGAVQIDDGRGSGFLAQRTGLWQANYKGSLDAIRQTLDLTATPQDSLRLRLCAKDVFESLKWSAAADFNRAPLAPFLDTARKLGVELPEKMIAEGNLSGTLEYSPAEGPTGSVEIRDASLSLPEARPLKAESVRIAVSRDAISMSPAIVTAEGENAVNESARVEGTYSFMAARDGAAGLDLKLTARAIPLAGLRSLGITDVPLADKVSKGTIGGSLRYRMGTWSGDYELRDTQVAVEGLASPVRLAYASVSAGGDRLAVTKIKASAGETKFSGEYVWDPKSPYPHKFKLQVDETTPQDLEKLFQPVLARGGGLLARTFRLGAAAPAWLLQRKAEGTVTIPEVEFGDHTLSVTAARVVWEGTDVKFAATDANIDGASVCGQVRADLTGALPRYKIRGKVAGMPYGGGLVDFDGRIETSGTGLALLAGLRAEGTFAGRAISFSPEAEFRSASGRFVLTVLDGTPRWKFSSLEVAQGSEMYTGDGGTQADGKIVLDLTSRGRQVRYTGPLVALAPQP